MLPGPGRSATSSARDMRGHPCAPDRSSRNWADPEPPCHRAGGHAPGSSSRPASASTPSCRDRLRKLRPDSGPWRRAPLLRRPLDVLQRRVPKQYLQTRRCRTRPAPCLPRCLESFVPSPDLQSCPYRRNESCSPPPGAGHASDLSVSAPASAAGRIDVSSAKSLIVPVFLVPWWIPRTTWNHFPLPVAATACQGSPGTGTSRPSI